MSIKASVIVGSAIENAPWLIGTPKRALKVEGAMVRNEQGHGG
jgi:hypothetical protein